MGGSVRWVVRADQPGLFRTGQGDVEKTVGQQQAFAEVAEQVIRALL
jgi:hypothetical protein